MKQTDPIFSGWVFVFPVKRQVDEETKKKHAEMWLKWLEAWNPPEEWMQ